MKALMHKEWRDGRLVLVVLTLLALAACVIVRAIDPVVYDAEWVAMLVLPALAAIFFGTVGTDLMVVADGDGATHLDALLPVSPLKLWHAKMGYLALSFAGFMGLLTIFNAGLISSRAEEPSLTAFAGELFAIVTDMRGVLSTLGAIVFGAAVLLFSSLLQRRSIAIWCAVVAIGSPLYFALFHGEPDRSSDIIAHPPVVEFLLNWFHWASAEFVLPVAALGWLALSLLVGCAAGFRPNWIRERRHVRRVLIGGLAPLFALLPFVGASAASVAGFAYLEPYSDPVAIRWIEPSHDGSRVALFVHKHRLAESRLWIVDVETGALEEVDGLGIAPFQPERGLFPLWTDRGLLVTSWDLSSSVRHTRIYRDGQLMAVDEAELLELLEPSAHSQRLGRAPKRSLLEGDPDDEGWCRWELLTNGHAIEVETLGWLRRNSFDDQSFGQAPDGSLFVIDHETGIQRIVVAAGALWSDSSTLRPIELGGSHVSVRSECGTRLIDFDSGQDVLPFSSSSVRLHRSAKRYVTLQKRVAFKDRIAYQALSSEYWLLDLMTGRKTQLDLYPWHVSSTGDGLLIADRKRVLHYDPESGAQRVLYEPRAQ